MNSPSVSQTFVPIVGRPNVGKSTLFNALIGEDRAVTASEPGVTRDRISEDLQWDDRTVTLVDTAGFQSDHPAPDPEFVVEQVREIIEQGTCIIFVVDAKEGVTPLDRDIAEQLYTVSDRVILAVNKVDEGGNSESAVSEFYELGLSNVVPISAAHRRNLDELRNSVTKRLPDETIEVPEEGIRTALVGRPNVGKSTLFNTILGYDRVMVSEEAGTTRDSISVSFTVNERRFHLMDTAGMRRKKNIEREIEQSGVYQSIRAIDFSDVVCLMVDWDERITNQDQRIAGLIKDRYRGTVILVNKADEPDADEEEDWVNHINDRLHFLKYAPVIFTSGTERRNLAEVFSTVGEIYDEMNRWLDEKVLQNALLDIKTRITWPSSEARPVIVKKARQIDINPVTLEVEVSDPQLLRKQDLRHLKRLLHEELEMFKSPLKLTIVKQTQHDE
ncbi:MAG: ribosome biogenesis GTPase Der [bacterium]